MNSVVPLLGVVFGAIGVLSTIYFFARQSSTAVAQAQAQAIRNAVEDATKPLNEQIKYWRDRADAFETELRQGGRK